jgi:ABC-type lipoprotein release transport system permease subunit
MLLWKLAFRNLFVHRLKTIVTGLIIVFGTTLAIVGNSLVDAISGGMQRSLTNSITGDLQIYAADAKEKIAVFGSMDGNLPDIGNVSDFKKIKDSLVQIDNIKSIIPMGINQAMNNPGNLLDLKLEELRQAYQAKPINQPKLAALKEHIQAIVLDVKKSQNDNQENLGGVYGGDKLFKNAPQDIAKALSPAFWADFDAHHDERQEFLANKIAPLIFDDNQLFLSYIGTVPELFQETFSQFEIVKGTTVPPGSRGFVFSDYVYENQIKHRVAKRLDQVKKSIEKDAQTIASTKDLRDKISANVSQSAEVYNQIDPVQSRVLLPKLKDYLKSEKFSMPELVQELLDMNDQNFFDRYAFFYKEIAPHLNLYKVKVGDNFAVTAYSKAGYSSSVNLKVYGTFRFKSFESSPLASNFNIMDMVSFRKLFGFMTSERRSESAQIDQEMGLKDFGKDDIESMFSQNTTVVTTKAPSKLRQFESGAIGRVDQSRRDIDTKYSRDEMENGVFLNAAIVLKDPRLINQTLRDIQGVAVKDNLGIQVATWRDSAGSIGQLTIIVRGVLYVFVAVIFAVATFIIMNSMLMAALERAREIGTMRAIGAQKIFLLRLFLRETFVLSFIFGSIGTVLALLFIGTVGRKGIPAMGDIATFFFSGDRLYLSANPLHIAIVFGCMTLVAILSTQYPAIKAMRISPLEAMQQSE